MKWFVICMLLLFQPVIFAEDYYWDKPSMELLNESVCPSDSSADAWEGQSPQQAIAARREIWDKRKQLVGNGLQRLSINALRSLLVLCGRADRAIKGREKSDPWQLMQEITSRMAGKAIIARP